MSRTMSVGLAAKYQASGKRLAKMIRIQTSLDTVVCMTDHDEPLIYDVIDEGDEVYTAGVCQFSDITQTAGVDPDNCEVTGPLWDEITKAGILGERFQGARAWIFEVDWSDLSLGHAALLGGEVAEAKVRGSEYMLDVRDWRERLAQTNGRAMLNTCDAEHTLPVDPRCGRTPETETITVTSAVDGMQFTGTITGARPDAYFNKGEVLGLDGENVGVKVKIESHTAAGVIKLRGFLPATPQIGDTFTLIRGCGKTRADCMERANMINFRGEPDSPGSDQLFRPTIPGQGND